MSIEHELEAAQSVLDNANYSLANALALDQPPEETPETNFLEQQLLQAEELERSAERAAALEPTMGDRADLQRAFDFFPLGRDETRAAQPSLTEADLLQPSPPSPAPSSPPPLPPSPAPAATTGEAEAGPSST